MKRRIILAEEFWKWYSKSSEASRKAWVMEIELVSQGSTSICRKFNGESTWWRHKVIWTLGTWNCSWIKLFSYVRKACIGNLLLLGMMWHYSCSSWSISSFLKRRGYRFSHLRNLRLILHFENFLRMTMHSGKLPWN